MALTAPTRSSQTYEIPGQNETTGCKGPKVDDALTFGRCNNTNKGCKSLI